MKKGKILGLAVLIMGLLSGCEKFEPEETAVSVNQKGQVVSYVKESFDKDYYSSDELEASIDQAILDYNTAGGSENVKKKKFEVKDQNAELTMSYASGDDYSKFNQVTFFTGDVLTAYQAGYDFSGKFQSVEKGQVTGADVTGNDILNSYNYGLVILTEPILVKVPGNIVYASDNVEITGKKSARVLSEAEAGAEAQEPETNEDGAISLSPVSSGSAKETEGSTAALAYILYEERRLIKHGKNNGQNCGTCKIQRFCLSGFRDLRRTGKHLGLWKPGCRAEKQRKTRMVEKIHHGKPLQRRCRLRHPYESPDLGGIRSSGRFL